MSRTTFVDFVFGLVRDAWMSTIRMSTSRKVFAAAVMLAMIGAVVFYEPPSITSLRIWADNTGTWFIVVFFLLYVTVTQFPIPRTTFTLASGVLFGPIIGSCLAILATGASAALSLVIVRNVIGEWLTPRLTHPAVHGVNARIRERGWASVLSLRMIAGVPFSILNYVAAMTSIGLLPFVFATIVGSAPGTVATVLLGDTLTGHLNPTYLVIAGALALVGFAGLLIDARLPVSSTSTPKSRLDGRL